VLTPQRARENMRLATLLRRVRSFSSPVAVFKCSRAAMVITLVIAFVGTVTIGFAAATTAGVIYACVNNNSGTIHIVSATSACATGEVALSWNNAGPQGATGATGAAGPTGATGATGPSGGGITYTYRVGGMYPGTSVAIAFCEPGEKVVGGGGTSTSGFPAFPGLTQSFPISDVGAPAFGTTAIGWQVASEGFNDVQANVVCAR